MRAYDPNNVFALILRGEEPCTKVYEDEFALHVLVVPKGPCVSAADFAVSAPAELIAGFWRAVGRTATRLGLDEPGYRLVSNHGADSNQEVFHLHVHIIGGQRLGSVSGATTRPG